MSDAEDTDDVERIRDRKRQELMEQLEDGGTIEEVAGTDAGTPAEPIHVEGPDHLGELTAAHEVVLVDFYADWCGPCQMLEPVVAEIARDTPAAVAKVDVDAHQGLAGQAGVRGVPTLLLYVDGEPAERMVGMQDQATLLNLIERHAG